MSGEGIRSDPAKVEVINRMASPQTVMEVRSFLGMTGFYHQCIPNYTTPLTALTKKHARFKWRSEEQRAWEALREAVTSEWVMVHPQVDKPYKLYTDASGYAVGAILVQEEETGLKRPVLYISKLFTGAEIKWSVIEKEAYAVVYSLEKRPPYLYNAKFEILVDHKPLKSLFLPGIKNTHLQRWAILLADYVECQ